MSLQPSFASEPVLASDHILGRAQRSIIPERVRSLKALGYQVVPTEPGEPKQLARSAKGKKQFDEQDFQNGEGIAIRTGRQDDDTFLCRIDLDSHGPGQDAHAAYQTVATHLGPIIDKCAVKVSNGGSGIDVVFKSPTELPNNQKIYIHGQWVGEVFCHGGRVNVPDTWLHGSLEMLQVLTGDEKDLLLEIITLQKGSRNPVSWTARAREGLPLIRGYRSVNTARLRDQTGMPKTFGGSEQKHRIAQDNWRRLKNAIKGKRSEALANYIQSLMLLATRDYGTTVEEKCRTVAAIAIEDYPGDEDAVEKTAKDIAALIAKILHNDRHTGREGHFKSPYWASEYRPTERPSGRPRHDRQKQLARLRHILNRNAEGMVVEKLGKQKLTVTALSKRLHVEKRTVQRYLADLEVSGEVKRHESSGRGGQLIITLLPDFGREQRGVAQSKQERIPPDMTGEHWTKDDRKCPERMTESVQKGRQNDPALGLSNALDRDHDLYILHREGEGCCTDTDGDERGIVWSDEDTNGAPRCVSDVDGSKECMQEKAPDKPGPPVDLARVTAVLRKATEAAKSQSSQAVATSEPDAAVIERIDQALADRAFREARLQAAMLRDEGARKDWLAYVDHYAARAQDQGYSVDEFATPPVLARAA
jgi:hypothetical protein